MILSSLMVYYVNWFNFTLNMRYISARNIHPDAIKKIERYLEEKGLFLNNISKAVNNFAIAHVSLIEEPQNIEEQSEFNVVINLRNNLLCKFHFYGHRTDGLRIYSQPKIGNFRIFDPAFHMSFIRTLSGDETPYILITYTDFIYDSRYDNGNYEGKIYASIIDFSALENYNNDACFKFDDCLHCDNSVKVFLIDDEKYPGFFAYSLISERVYDDLYIDEYEIVEQNLFDGIWNKTLWCTNRRIIPLDGENIYDKADEMMNEIRDEQHGFEDD